MDVHPDVEALIAAARVSGSVPFERMDPCDARDAYAARREALQRPAETVGSCRDLAVPGPAGPVPLRSYRPLGAATDEVLPCLVYMHGGGWMLGGLDSHDALCCRLANQAGCAVFAVDYRLAPEHPFPAALDDCIAAYAAIVAQAPSLRINPACIAVGGDSAGGNLATVLALMGRDGTLPPPVCQLLLYPAVDLGLDLAGYGVDTPGMVITGATMVYFRDNYVPVVADRAGWRASPLRAASLAGVAPAFVLTCGHDPLLAEGRAYAARMAGSGVRVTHLDLSDQTHGMLTMTRVIGIAAAIQDLVAAALHDGLRERTGLRENQAPPSTEVTPHAA